MQSPSGWDGRYARVTGGASGIGEQVTGVPAAAGAGATIAGIDGARTGALAAGLSGASEAVIRVTAEAAWLVLHHYAREARFSICATPTIDGASRAA